MSQLESHPSQPRGLSAWYSAEFETFCQDTTDHVVGVLTRNSAFDILGTQRNAWETEVSILRQVLRGHTGHIALEYSIPRLGGRIDAVLLIGETVIVVEFKIGQSEANRADINQTWDYALDLKNFHKESHHSQIVPALVLTNASKSLQTNIRWDADQVARPLILCTEGLEPLLKSFSKPTTNNAASHHRWLLSAYSPTPTIIEAAKALYAQHSVEAIARYDAGAKNLSATSGCIAEIIREAKQNRKKAICFVTGVPGAGKTLVGLNVTTSQMHHSDATPAVFLSGNGPLVAVLREALSQDDLARRRAAGDSTRIGVSRQSVKSFIQNVHHFRDDGLRSDNPPPEHVAVFDEAQRAWDHQQTANFMARKKGRPNFPYSEPEFLIQYMDRHPDWAVIVCLVGGGQEINSGEAGIQTWIEAVRRSFPHWEVHASKELFDSEFNMDGNLSQGAGFENFVWDPRLHLSVSMRSFRAEHVSNFVRCLLDCEVESAKTALSQLQGRYPSFITRNLSKAKDWVRTRARGTERYGLVASSRAQRLRPHAVDVRIQVDPVHWFLKGPEDTRSSYYLEDAGTEYIVQGLELDWVLLAWDGDLRYSRNGWQFSRFRGDRWQQIRQIRDQRYLRNAYRVLLTRARQGMVLFVPQGDPMDPTRPADIYDPTYHYLRSLGIPSLDQND